MKKNNKKNQRFIENLKTKIFFSKKELSSCQWAFLYFTNFIIYSAFIFAF